jgi:anti-anti-sigma regulatory factor
MKNMTQTALPFPSTVGASVRRELQKQLAQVLRASEFPVIIDLSDRHNLDHRDIETLLGCLAQAVGRDTQVIFVAGSPAIRILLEVTRIASLTPVFDSMEDALAYPKMAAVEPIRAHPFESPRAA